MSGSVLRSEAAKLEDSAVKAVTPSTTRRRLQISLQRLLGIVTVSAVLAWILMFLGSNPLPQERLLRAAEDFSGYKRDELRVVGGGYGSNWVRKWSFLKLQADVVQPKTIYIEMERYLHQHEWQVSDYRVGD